MRGVERYLEIVIDRKIDRKRERQGGMSEGER